MRILALTSLIAVLALAACGQKEPEETPANNTALPYEEDLPTDDTPAPANVQNTAKPAPPPEIPVEQQTLDDADATGLTARLPGAEEEAVVPATPPAVPSTTPAPDTTPAAQ